MTTDTTLLTETQQLQKLLQNKGVQYRMKKYTKPSVQVVNLKSSNDIAAAKFDTLRETMLKNYMFGESKKEYSVSVYSNTASTMDAIPPAVEI